MTGRAARQGDTCRPMVSPGVSLHQCCVSSGKTVRGVAIGCGGRLVCSSMVRVSWWRASARVLQEVAVYRVVQECEMNVHRCSGERKSTRGWCCCEDGVCEQEEEGLTEWDGGTGEIVPVMGCGGKGEATCGECEADAEEVGGRVWEVACCA